MTTTEILNQIFLTNTTLINKISDTHSVATLLTYDSDGNSEPVFHNSDSEFVSDISSELDDHTIINITIIPTPIPDSVIINILLTTK